MANGNRSFPAGGLPELYRCTPLIYIFRSLVDLNKLQNEYEQKLDNQEKSIQDIQERAEGLSNERTIVKARFHFDTSLIG